MRYLNINESDIDAIVRLLSGDEPLSEKAKALIDYEDEYVDRMALGIQIATTYLDKMKLRYPFLSYVVEDEGIEVIRVFIPKEEGEEVYIKIYDEVDELQSAIDDITFGCLEGNSLYIFALSSPDEPWP